MKDQPKRSAVELALVAAVLDPELARTSPEEAVWLANRLIQAAQEKINYPSLAARMIADMDEAAARVPLTERVSLPAAFKNWGGHYKNAENFIDALQNEELTIFDQKGEEKTSQRLVAELFKRLRARRQRADRLRKSKLRKATQGKR